MNLSSLETAVDRTILQRGKNYTAFVSNLEETEPEFWQAYVEGTDSYDVEIQLAGDEVADWSCTCPYDHGPVCKHVVAVLLNIRSQQQSGATKAVPTTKAPTKREQLEQLLTTLPRETLVDYLRQLLHGDRNLLDKFLLRYQPTVSGGEAVSKQYQQLFNNLVRQHSSHGLIEYDDASAFGDEVSGLLDTLSASSLPPIDRVEACFTIAEGIAGVANNIDDSNGELGTLMDAINHELATAYPHLPATAQPQLFQRVLAAHFDERYRDFGLEDAFAELLKTWATDNQDYQDTYLQALDHSIQASTKDWWRDALLRQKLGLLKTWGRQADVEAVATAHMEIPEFRETFVQQAMEAKDFAKAKALLQEGILLAEQKGHPGTASKWRKYLLDIAYQLGDTPTIRAELERMFKESRYSLEPYQQLKATYTAEEWSAVRQHLYQLVPPAAGYDQVRAYLLKEENDLPALFALLQDTSGAFEKTHLFKHYAPLLASQFPQEVTAQYASIICTEVQGSTGRNIYERIIWDLKILQKMPGGEVMAQNLIRDFRNRYKTRKAMLEMFAKAFGKG